MSAREPLTAARLRQVLRYDPETGIFTWLVSRGRAKAGAVAGNIVRDRDDFYWMVTVDGCTYGAHRLAWLYMTGEWPRDLVDHRNKNGLANNWTNLREATPSQNQMNRKKRSDAKCLPKGVHLSGGKYIAQVFKEGIRYPAGSFTTAEEAGDAYIILASKIHGEFLPEDLKARLRELC